MVAGRFVGQLAGPPNEKRNPDAAVFQSGRGQGDYRVSHVWRRHPRPGTLLQASRRER